MHAQHQTCSKIGLADYDTSTHACMRVSMLLMPDNKLACVYHIRHCEACRCCTEVSLVCSVKYMKVAD